jgi:hypothetical protein
LIIIDLEYYLSTNVSKAEAIRFDFIPNSPDCIELDTFGNWSPVSNSIFNFLFNYQDYNQTSISYLFHNFQSTSEVYGYFKGNNNLIDTISSLLSVDSVYMITGNEGLDTENILNLQQSDLEIINQIISGNTSATFISENPIITSLINLISYFNNPLSFPKLDLIEFSTMNNISKVMYYIYIRRLLLKIIETNSISELN